MMRRFKLLVLGALFVGTVAAPVAAVALPATASAVAITTVKDCQKRVLGIPPWYRGLVKIESTTDADGTTTKTCVMKSPGSDLAGYIWHIVLNVIEMAIVIVAYVAVFFIIYGGFQFLVGGSNPGMVEKGRKTITNAVIGLIIAMAAIAINNLIFSIIT